MTIPEISPLFIFSMCGLSVVCLGVFGVGAYMFFRFTSGELFELVGGFWGGGDDNDSLDVPVPQASSARRDLRARAQSYDFDAAVQNQSQGANPNRFGENTNLRPDQQNTLNPAKRDLNLRPPGTQSDNPDALHAPPPPNFNPNSEYLPNSNSNVGGRVGRWNTGRGQDGQRMDSFGSTPNAPDGLGKNRSARFDEGRRTRRNSNRNDDEVFGGMLDADGDGDVDY